MHFEQMEVLFDLLDQSQPLSHQVDGPDSAVAVGPCLGTQVITDIAGADYRLLLRLPVARCQPACDSALTLTQGLWVVSAHSKCCFHRLVEFYNKPISTHV